MLRLLFWNQSYSVLHSVYGKPARSAALLQIPCNRIEKLLVPGRILPAVDEQLIQPLLVPVVPDCLNFFSYVPLDTSRFSIAPFRDLWIEHTRCTCHLFFLHNQFECNRHLYISEPPRRRTESQQFLFDLRSHMRYLPVDYRPKRDINLQKKKIQWFRYSSR